MFFFFFLFLWTKLILPVLPANDECPLKGLSFGLSNLGSESANMVEWSSSWSEVFKDKANTTAYDILGQAYSVIITWGFDKRVGGDQSAVNLPRSSVACVRATGVVDGQSVLPNSGVSKEEEKYDDEKDEKDEKKDNRSFTGIWEQGEEDEDDESGAGRGLGVSMWGVMAGGVAVGLVLSG